MAGFDEQLADDPLRKLIFALAEMVVADPPFAIDEIMGGPEAVFERAPQPEVVIERDGIVDAELGNRLADIGGFPLEREFRRVDADDDQAMLGITIMPGADVWQGAQAIDAGIGPEIDQDDLAAKLLAGERLAVDPRAESVERGQRALDRELQPPVGQGRDFAVLGDPVDPELAGKPCFQRCCLRARKFGQHPRVEPERDRADRDKHKYAQDPPKHFDRAQACSSSV